MDIEAIRTEMLTCHANVQTGIMIQRGKVNLMWNAGNEMHCESLSTDECVIGSEEFNGALERARVSLIH